MPWITFAACSRRSQESVAGLGEFTVHKEFVSAKVAGETASLLNPALGAKPLSQPIWVR